MADKDDGVLLADILAGILKALTEAKHLGDVESARLIDVYRQGANLSSFSVPAFTVSGTELELRFAIVENQTEGEKVRVHVSPEHLKDLQPHQINVMRLHFSPATVYAFDETGEE